MNMKNLLLMGVGVILGVALSAGVLKVGAGDAPEDPNAEILKKLVEQNEKLLSGQEAILKDLAAIKSDLEFIKARSAQ